MSECEQRAQPCTQNASCYFYQQVIWYASDHELLLSFSIFFISSTELFTEQCRLFEFFSSGVYSALLFPEYNNWFGACCKPYMHVLILDAENDTPTSSRVLLSYVILLSCNNDVNMQISSPPLNYRFGNFCHLSDWFVLLLLSAACQSVVQFFQSLPLFEGLWTKMTIS